MSHEPSSTDTLASHLATTIDQPTSVAESFEACRRLTRRSAGNFYYAFRVLPADRFRDTCALYAFMRVADDLGDDEAVPVEDRRRALRKWREGLHAAVSGERFDHWCLPALAAVVQEHAIPPRYLEDVVRGVESDLDHAGFATFEDLQEYCYKVAGAVGICCIHVWGMRNERAIDAAIDLGTAFQLTNILRDLGEDAAMNRVYLPAEDIDRFGYSPDRLKNGVRDEAFRDLLRFEVSRARDYYDRGSRIFDDVEPEARPILSAMIRIYRGLLDEIERRDFDVFGSRVRLSRVRKLWISVDTILRRWWSGTRAETALPR